MADIALDLMANFQAQFKHMLESTISEVQEEMKFDRWRYPLEMTRDQAAEMFGIAPKTFDSYAARSDFPKITTRRRVKYPRDPMIEWYNTHWQEL